ncbi:hypothetical protein [Klebsiella oxytoca]
MRAALQISQSAKAVRCSPKFSRPVPIPFSAQGGYHRRAR